MPKNNLIISLTTISSRIREATNTIKCLLNQNTKKNYEVHLYLSQEPYLLDEGFQNIPDEINDLLNEYSHFHVKWTLNTGPYRKLLPALADAWACRADRIIITCDDDVDYPNDFLEIITEAHQKNNCITAFRGYTIQADNDKILPYTTWQISKIEQKSLRNVPTGKDGILYRASYFDEGVFNLTNIYAICPTTDDLWFKWHTAIKNIPVEFIAHPSNIEFPSSKNSNKNNTLFRKFNKLGGNDKSVNLLEQFFLKNKKESLAISLFNNSYSTDYFANNDNLPSLLKAANNSLKSGDLSNAENLYKEILKRNPLNNSALFNLAHLRMRIKDSKSIFTFYQLFQNSKINENIIFRLIKNNIFQFEDDLVLVIIPAFNSSQTLRQSIESVLNQTYKKIFIIIVSDCSNDETLSISFDLECRNKNIATLWLDENRGPFNACNYALDLMRLSNFKYFIKHDADDLMEPKKIDKQINAINSGEYSLCTTGYSRINFPDKSIVSGKKRGHNMTLYRRSVFDKLGFFDNTRFGGDTEYLERALLCFGEDAEVHINEKLTLAYKMPGSIVDENPLGSDLRIKYMDSFRLEHKKQKDRNNWHKEFFLNSQLSKHLNYISEFNHPISKDEVILSSKSSFKKTLCVAFPTFNRQLLMEQLLNQIDLAAKNYNLEILIFDDGSTTPVSVDWSRFENVNRGYIFRNNNHGKAKYWKLVNQIFNEMKRINADYYYYLGDDLQINDDFFEKSINIWDNIYDPAKVSLNLLNDGREECWTKFRRIKKIHNGLEVYLSQWLDMIMLVSPVVLSYHIDMIPLSRWEKNPLLSSGVGSQLSTRLLSDGFNMYQACSSLVFHGTHESQMNPEERSLRSLVSI
jgi:glycosyltransferase involved in cell wall biosynthesis